jgi:hypothetical protein
MSIPYNLRVNSNKLEEFFSIAYALHQSKNTFYNHSAPFQYIVRNFLKDESITKREIKKYLINYPKDLRIEICLDDEPYNKFEEKANHFKMKRSQLLTALMYKFIEEYNKERVV